MSQLDLLKILESKGEETDLADYTPEELQELLRQLENGDGVPMTAEEFKKKYFAYYDDVKDKTLSKQDW